MRLRTLLQTTALIALTLSVGSTIATAAAQDTPGQANNATAGRFITADLIINAGNSTLGAYQLTFDAPDGIELVGIYGGDSEAFNEPPAYDPRALQQNRVVLAAFAPEGAAVPSGDTRVASLALYTTTQSTDWTVTLTAAADQDAKRIQATARAITAPANPDQEREPGAQQ